MGITRLYGIRNFFLAGAAVATLAACGTMGDTGAVKDAYQQAIACETDKALASVDRAARGGGLGAELADLQGVVILRDAGRTSEAAAALAERNARVNADAEAAAEAEKGVAESLAELRAERQESTGRRTCR